MLEKLSRWAEALAGLPARRLLAAGAALAVVAGLFLFLYRPASPARVERVVPAAAEAEEARAKVLVHVAGAVIRPEVYEMKEGQRVSQAIERAGGLLPDADIRGINLAEQCRDGQKIYVPRAGELESEGAAGGAQAMVNINTASQKQLEELPGIGPKLAADIIKYREKNNGFSSVEELKQVKGIGDSKFEDLRELVTI